MLLRITLTTLSILFLFISGITDVHSFSPSHNIQIEFDLKTHTIKAIDHLSLYTEKGGELLLSLNKDIHVISIRDRDDKELRYSIEEGDEGKKRLTIFLPPPIKGEIDLDVEYDGRFPVLLGDIKFSREFISDRPVAYVGEEIILLDGSSCWYPCIDANATFKVTAATSSGYEVIMEGTRLSHELRNDMIITTWDFPHPSSGIYLVGGRYDITEDRYNDIIIYTYFFREDVGLSATYIDHTKRYLEIYERLLGKYPFKKFAIVENILPTGFGMPSYTLLGQSVLRLPFIVKTSLGHEIAHSWWGNSVYPDYESGNWSEGLTTYLADHLYDEMEGRGTEYRNQILRDYINYVKPSKEYSITKFKNRIVPEDRAIGYGKGAYVFHMLRVMLGDEVFYKGLKEVIVSRSFKVTRWDDFRIAFEKVSGKNLGWFFKQWVEGIGAPSINLGDVRVKGHNKGFIIEADILQKGRAYEIYMPLLVKTEEGPLLTYHWIKELHNTIEIKVPSRPRSITIDPYYDVFRRLNPEEIPATISRFIGAEKGLIVLPSRGSPEILDAYSKAASIVEGGSIKTDKDVTEEDLRKNSIYILGGAGENILMDKFISRLPPEIKIEGETISVTNRPYSKKDSVLVVAIPNPENQGSVLLLFSGYKPEYITSVGERLVHYGKYSYLLFVNGENKEKGIWEVVRLRKAF